MDQSLLRQVKHIEAIERLAGKWHENLKGRVPTVDELDQLANSGGTPVLERTIASTAQEHLGQLVLTAGKPQLDIISFKPVEFRGFSRIINGKLLANQALKLVDSRPDEADPDKIYFGDPEFQPNTEFGIGGYITFEELIRSLAKERRLELIGTAAIDSSANE